MIHRALAARLAEEVRAEPKECYRNAVLAFAHFEANRDRFGDYFEGEIGAAYYIEGIASIMDGMLHIDHGWLEVDGVVVDVTLDDLQPSDYLAVVRYTLAEVMAYVKRERTLPYFVHERERRRKMGEAMHGRYESSINGRDVRGELEESSGVGSGHGEG